MAIDHRKKCRRLRDGHDGSKREWITVCVVTVRDSADGMAKYLDGRLWNMFVIVRRARLAEILQVPWGLLASFDVQFRANASEVTKVYKRCIGPTTSAAKHRIIGFWRMRHNVPNVFVDDSVHRSVERLASLDSPKINPSPSA
jgi:hypothetical protein